MPVRVSCRSFFRRSFLLFVMVVFLNVCSKARFRRAGENVNVRPTRLSSKNTLSLQKSITDVCSKKEYTCDTDDSFAYVFYLTNLKAAVTTQEETLSTYFDYALRAINRTLSLSGYSVVVLCTEGEDAHLIGQITSLSPRVRVVPIQNEVWLKPFHEFQVVQKRPKLMHAYGTTQVFNPRFTGQFKRLIFMDVDTFLVRNIDELFCTRGFAAAKRPGVAFFNGGVFSFQPSEQLYNRMMKNMLQYMKEPGEKKFAMQALLHRTIGENFFCVDPVYNCHGLCGAHGVCEMLSSKCAVRNELDLLQRGAIVHAKLSQRSVAKHVPNLHKLWLSYGPVESVVENSS